MIFTVSITFCNGTTATYDTGNVDFIGGIVYFNNLRFDLRDVKGIVIRGMNLDNE